MKRLFPTLQIQPGPGGATLIALTRRDVPLVFSRVFCPGGEAWESVESPGLVELTESLFNEGPAHLSPQQWHKTLDQNALSLDFAFEERHWHAGARVLTEDVEAAFGLLEKWIPNPGLPKSEWKRLVKTERASAKEAWAQPSGILGNIARMQQLGWGHINARFSHDRSLARVRYEEACGLGRRAFGVKGQRYGLIGGDLEAREGFDRLTRLFECLPQPAAGDPGLPDETDPRPSRYNVWIVDNPTINQAYFALSRMGIRAGDPDRVALRLANYALGGGSFSSRLMQRVREEMGHTYGISSSLSPTLTMNPFLIHSFTQVENLADMLKLIDRVIREILDAGFTEEEVDDAREHNFGALPLKMTSPSSVLQIAMHGMLAGLNLEQMESDWQSIRDTSKHTVDAAARRILGDGRFHLALIGPAEKIRPLVEAYGEAAVFPFKTTPDRWPR